MALMIIPYTDPKQPGSVAHAIARTENEVDALVQSLQRQGYRAGLPVPVEPCWPPKV
jgi:hypothetical protein